MTCCFRLVFVKEVLCLGAYAKVFGVDAGSVVTQVPHNMTPQRYCVGFAPGDQFIYPQPPFTPLQPCRAILASQLNASVRSFHTLLYQFTHFVL
jgi:hypothetical protein|tara:strand:- start:41 stop:322 length:282 start_codon:yes stop_codon:yes gene_type:complete